MMSLGISERFSVGVPHGLKLRLHILLFNDDLLSIADHVIVYYKQDKIKCLHFKPTLFIPCTGKVVQREGAKTFLRPIQRLTVYEICHVPPSIPLVQNHWSVFLTIDRC
jgi:hypothetical protein